MKLRKLGAALQYDSYYDSYYERESINDERESISALNDVLEDYSRVVSAM